MVDDICVELMIVELTVIELRVVELMVVEVMGIKFGREVAVLRPVFGLRHLITIRGGEAAVACAVRLAGTLLEASTLALRQPTPDTESLVLLQGVLQTFHPDIAR